VRAITLSLLQTFEISVGLAAALPRLDDDSGGTGGLRPKQGGVQIVLVIDLVEVELLEGAQKL